MSTLAEIESAARQLSLAERQQLLLVIAQSLRESGEPLSGPDFLARAKAVWGDAPAGVSLSQVVSDARGGGA